MWDTRKIAMKYWAKIMIDDEEKIFPFHGTERFIKTLNDVRKSINGICIWEMENLEG